MWQAPRTRAVFGTSAEFAAQTKVLAANQGLYNGFLAAGLVWALWLGAEGRGVALFFLGCVLVAGIYGAATAAADFVCAGFAERAGDFGGLAGGFRGEPPAGVFDKEQLCHLAL